MEERVVVAFLTFLLCGRSQQRVAGRSLNATSLKKSFDGIHFHELADEYQRRICEETSRSAQLCVEM